MTTRLSIVLLPALLLAPAFAQDEAPPGPAPELQKLAPMIGNWTGKGQMSEPSGVTTAWKAHGSYRWCLGGHFVQEDFRIKFDGNPVPMVFRAYVGWDRENSRYVSAVATNGGQAQLNEIKLMPDGTILTLMLQEAAGMPYAERSRMNIDGDEMSMTIDMLMPAGPSMQIIEGSFARIDASFDGQWDAGGWMGARPVEAMQRLARMAGEYETKGEMVMAPGAPAMKISGTDVFTDVWAGNAIRARTVGSAEGFPGQYESDGFWAWDARRSCINAIWADSMGQIGEMEMRWVEDKLVGTSAALQQGMPTTQRFVVSFDENGVCTGGVGDTIMGAMPPFQSMRATYEKK